MQRLTFITLAALLASIAQAKDGHNPGAATVATTVKGSGSRTYYSYSYKPTAGPSTPSIPVTTYKAPKAAYSSSQLRSTASSYASSGKQALESRAQTLSTRAKELTK